MREQKITLGEMRASGVTGLLIYCSDYRCSHHIKISAEPWPDQVRLIVIQIGDKIAKTSSVVT